MSAMAAMSRAIRLQVEEHSTDGSIQGLPDEVLREHADIVGAYFYDLREEQKRRKQAADQRETEA